MVLAITGLTLAWPLYRLIIANAHLVLFDEVILLPDWQIYAWSVVVGVGLGLLLWGLFEWLKSAKRVILSLLVTGLLLAWLIYGQDARLDDVVVYVVAVVGGLLLSLVLWGSHRLLRWLYRKLWRRPAA